MKKAFSLIALCACLFISCDESEYEVHQTYFNPTSPQGKTLYADQTVDSVRVISYDPWTAQTNFTGEAWFTITPTQCNFVQGENISNTRLDINATPNNTEKVRAGFIAINSYYNIGMNVYQMSWLNIHYPIGRLVTADSEGNELKKEEQYCVFEGTAIDKKNQFEIIFTTYAADATISSDAEWITFEKTNFETAGNHTVLATCEANPLSEARTANIHLTSKGITTPIIITQERKRD